MGSAWSCHHEISVIDSLEACVINLPELSEEGATRLLRKQCSGEDITLAEEEATELANASAHHVLALTLVGTMLRVGKTPEAVMEMIRNQTESLSEKFEPSLRKQPGWEREDVCGGVPCREF